MEQNKQISHISWLISASKEQMQFLTKEFKNAFESPYIKKDHVLLKSSYHLNLARILLTQVEKNYIAMIRGGRFFSSVLMHIKNTYLQRSCFQLSMSFDYFKEGSFKIEQISPALHKSLFSKWSQLTMMLNQLVREFDCLLSSMKE